MALPTLWKAAVIELTEAENGISTTLAISRRGWGYGVSLSLKSEVNAVSVDTHMDSYVRRARIMERKTPLKQISYRRVVV